MLCFVIGLICATALGGAAVPQLSKEASKIFVDANYNQYTTQRNRIKPTSHIVEHQPGVPPGWHNVPIRPVILGNLFSFRKLPRESNIIEVTELYPFTTRKKPSSITTESTVTSNWLTVNENENEISNNTNTIEETAVFDEELDEVSNSTEVTEEISIPSNIINKFANSTETINNISNFTNLNNMLNFTVNNEPEVIYVEDLYSDLNITRPPVGQPQPVIFENGVPDDKTNDVFSWVLNTFGINRPGVATPAPPASGGSQPVDNNNNNSNNNNNKPMRACKSCLCGDTFKQTRIVGGVETEVNAYPWVVSLNYKGNFYCGGSLISDLYVLCAAHCTSFPKEQITIILLEHDRKSPSETKTITRKVTNIYKHKNYNMGGSYNNDIALLKLNSPLQFDGLLHPVCLPPIGPNFNGDIGVAVGWGATSEGGSVSSVLREVAVPILSNEACRKTKYGSKITENMMCAGDTKNGMIDSCQGDSGGPLHVVKNGKNLIAGIVSWGEGCAQKDYPGVYTRVNRYISWIMKNTQDSCYCQNTK